MSDRNELATRYRDAVERTDLPTLTRLYHPDALLDAHVPNWRFQVIGRSEVARVTGTGLPGPGHFERFEHEATVDGDLLIQLQWHQHTEDGAGARSRQLHVLRLEGDRIVSQTLFCAGVWSPALQERMADEAPLVRP